MYSHVLCHFNIYIYMLTYGCIQIKVIITAYIENIHIDNNGVQYYN